MNDFQRFTANVKEMKKALSRLTRGQLDLLCKGCKLVEQPEKTASKKELIAKIIRTCSEDKSKHHQVLNRLLLAPDSPIKESETLRKNGPENEHKNWEKLHSALYESSKLNRTLGLSFTAFMFYLLIILASTTDKMLLASDSIVVVPILNISIPLVGFYVVTPFLIVLFHFNLLFNLSQHRSVFDACFELSPDKTSFYNGLHPFLFNRLTRFKKSNPTRILLVSVIHASFFLFPLFNLLYFMGRFEDYHHFWYTNLHFLALCIDVFIIVLYYDSTLGATATTTGESTREATVRSAWRGSQQIFAFLFSGRRFVWIPLFIGLLFLFVNVDLEVGWYFTPRKWVPKISLKGEILVSKEPSDEIISSFIEKGLETETAIDSAYFLFSKGLNISGRDLRFAELTDCKLYNLVGSDVLGDSIIANRIFAPFAELPHSSFRGGDFTRASLAYAWMPNTTFEGSTFFHGNLEYANLVFANFNAVSCIGAKFDGIRIKGAKLRGADFQSSQIRGGSFGGSDLRGTNFAKADLRGSSFWHCDLKGGNLERINAGGADFCKADLKGAYLSLANLNGASLRLADLRGSHCRLTQLQGADLMKADLSGAFWDRMAVDSSLLNLRIGTNPIPWDSLLMDSILIPMETRASFSQEFNYQRIYSSLMKEGKKRYEKFITGDTSGFYSGKPSQFLVQETIEKRLRFCCKDPWLAFGILRQDETDIVPLSDGKRRLNGFMQKNCPDALKKLSQIEKDSQKLRLQ